MGALFGIPSLEDITISNATVFHFRTSCGRLTRLPHDGKTSLRRLRWIRGLVSSKALEQILQFPSQLEEITLRLDHEWPHVGGPWPSRRDWWNITRAISDCQPNIRCLDIKTPLRDRRKHVLYLACFRSLTSYIGPDRWLARHTQYGCRQGLPASITTLELEYSCKPRLCECCEPRLCACCKPSLATTLSAVRSLPNLKHIRYAVTAEGLSETFRDWCKQAGVELFCLYSDGSGSEEHNAYAPGWYWRKA